MAFIDPDGEMIGRIIQIGQNYLYRLGSSPDTMNDLRNLTQDASRGDIDSVVIDTICLAIPGADATIAKGAIEVGAKKVVKQLHHWINQATLKGVNKHELILEAFDMGIDIRKAGWNIDEIIHQGGHTDKYYDFVRGLLDKAYKSYESSGFKWTKEEMETALKDVASKTKSAVEKGEVSLYKEKK